MAGKTNAGGGKSTGGKLKEGDRKKSDGKPKDAAEKREMEDARQRKAPRAAVIHEAIRIEGREELHRPPSELAWSGVVAGLSMGFSLLAQGFIYAQMPDVSWRSLVVKLGYGLGFLIVILGRQQLFTENTLTAVLPLLRDRDRETALRVLRLWGVVLSANLAGAFAFAWLTTISGAFDPEMHRAFSEIARAALKGDFATTVAGATYAGWIVALVVWLGPYAETARPFMIMLLSYIIGVGELDHIIAGSVEVFYLVTSGELSPLDYVTRYFAPTLLGNMLGGVVFVALLNHGQVASGSAISDAQEEEKSVN